MRLLVVLTVVVTGVVTTPQHWSPYNWQYQTQHVHPGQAQVAARNAYQYIDVHGNPVVFSPFSQPNVGFKYDTAQQGAAEPQALKYAQEPLVRTPLLPLTKLAVDTGVVQPTGRSPWGVLEYAVSPHLAAEVGGVSSLAYRLGAIPVAAVHDVQQRPNYIDTDTAFAPVLVHDDTPKVTLYTLQIPTEK